MTKLYDCEDLNTEQVSSEDINAAQLNQFAECPATVHETVCVQADIIITPVVTVGDIQSFCVGTPVIGECPGTPSPTMNCSFSVSQSICVQVPLTFSALGEAVPTGIVCGTPGTGPCPPATGCTFSRGYYFNHPVLTNTLITDAGGSIILGINQQGLSFTVTPGNASTVLSGNTPLPPGVPPVYENLYAQLLAANLNVQRGVTCDFAVTTIASANTFLATSPPDQVTASQLVNDLTLFNEGLATGCPGACPEI